MRTELLTLTVAALVLCSVGRPWMKAVGVGVALSSSLSLTILLAKDIFA